MSIFELHRATLQDYRDFVESFIRIADPRIREFVEENLFEQGHLWPEPLVQLSPAYRRAQTPGTFRLLFNAVLANCGEK